VQQIGSLNLERRALPTTLGGYFFMARRDGASSDLLHRGAGRLKVMGYGEGVPLASNLSEANKQLNRRVEIVAVN
jgi:hypothetical protein